MAQVSIDGGRTYVDAAALSDPECALAEDQLQVLLGPDARHLSDGLSLRAWVDAAAAKYFEIFQMWPILW